MPIYAYRCDSCGHQKDVLQKMSDPVLTVCPACGRDTFTKQLTAAGFQLKGSGWYATDFKGGSAKSGAAAGATAAGADAAGGSASSGGDSAGAAGGASAGGSTGAGTASAPAAGCGGGCACH